MTSEVAHSLGKKILAFFCRFMVEGHIQRECVRVSIHKASLQDHDNFYVKR